MCEQVDRLRAHVSRVESGAAAKIASLERQNDMLAQLLAAKATRAELEEVRAPRHTVLLVTRIYSSHCSTRHTLLFVILLDCCPA